MTWNVSGMFVSTLLSILWPCIKPRSSKVTKSKRSGLKFWDWVVWYMFFGSDFRQQCKNDRRTFFKCLHRTKFENRKKCRTPRERRISDLLGIQNGKTQPFYKIVTKPLYTYSSTSVTSHTYLFSNSKTFLGNVEHIFMFSPIFKNFQVYQIWDSSLTANFNLHVLLKTV